MHRRQQCHTMTKTPDDNTFVGFFVYGVVALLAQEYPAFFDDIIVDMDLLIANIKKQKGVYNKKTILEMIHSNHPKEWKIFINEEEEDALKLKHTHEKEALMMEYAQKKEALKMLEKEYAKKIRKLLKFQSQESHWIISQLMAELTSI